MSIVDSLFSRLGYTKATPAPLAPTTADPERLAQDPLAMAYASMSQDSGLRRSSGITMQTLKRMSRVNWVDRTCIVTLRDEVTAQPWDIVPIDAHKPFNDQFQQFLIKLLKRPDRFKGTWRQLIDQAVEDILVYDAGVFEKVRNGRGEVVELYYIDGSTIKPCFDEHGLPGDPAYQQFINTGTSGSLAKEPVAAWNNNDLVYMRWNPQGGIDTYGYGLSPVEAGLAVGTSFLQAEAYNLQFFSSNSIPPVLIQMGKDVSVGEVEKFKTFLSYEMTGQDGFHKPIVGSFGDGFDIKELMKAPTEMGFKDYVEWQMRWKVALYRMSPHDIGFNLDMYKAEGEVQQELSKGKAIGSLKGVLADYINNEIVTDDGYGALSDNLEFRWTDTGTVAPLEQAQIDEIYLKNGVNSINEVRQRRGEDPITGGAKPTITLGQQVVPIDSTLLEGGDEADQAEDKRTEPAAEEGAADTQKSITGAEYYDYQSTQLDFPPEISRRVKALGRAIPDEQISVDPDDPTKGREDDIHVTVLYGLSDQVKADDIQKVVSDSGPIEITLGKTSVFDSDDYDVLKVEVAGQAIRDLHTKLLKSLGAPGYTFPSYEPHVTIAYLKKGEGAKYAGDTALQGQTVVFDTLQFSTTDGKKTSLPLSNGLSKALTGPITPHDWERSQTLNRIEQRLGELFQAKLTAYYHKLVHVGRTKRTTLTKTSEFDPNQDYLVSGTGVYQNGVKYPLSVLPPAQQPSPADFAISVADYRDAFELGTKAVTVDVTTQFPDLTVRAPELYEPAFTQRVNYLANELSDTLKALVDKKIVEGIDGGKSYGEIADDIRQALAVDPKAPDFPQWRAERIARSESMWAINEGMRQQYNKIGITKVNVLTAGTACDQCVDVARGNPYTLAQAEGLLPAHPNCVIGGQEILALGVATKFIADYDGPTVTITTAKGTRATVTPNHLMLTGRGWVKAAELEQGDDLLHTSSEFEKMAFDHPNIKPIKSLIEEVAVPGKMILTTVPASPVDLHGDGVFCEDIDIIRADSSLGTNLNTTTSKSINDQSLVGTLTSEVSLDTQGAEAEVFDASVAPANSLVGSEGVSSVLSSTPLAHHETVGLDLITQLDAVAQEVFVNRSASNAELIGELIHGNTGLVALDKVVDIELNSLFHGKVYDLETSGNWYTVNNIITHNCRCDFSGDFTELLAA